MTKERSCQDDLIRVVAMLLVIMLHCNTYIINVNLTGSICFACNMMFFMLSGKYNLRFTSQGNTNRAYIFFYKKRFINIFVPFFIYSFIYYIYTVIGSNWPLSFIIKKFVYDFAGNNINGMYWFMYTLIGLIISTPFWAKLVQNLSDFELILLAIITFVWNLISIIITQDIMQAPFAFSNWILSAWNVPFVLGYINDRLIKTKKQVYIFMILGVICWGITFCRMNFFRAPTVDIYAYSPFYIIYALGLYLLLERVLIVKNKAIQKIITFLARHSFSVYLIHAFMLVRISDDKILKHLPNISGYQLWLLKILIIFTVSLSVAIIVDNILINPIKRLLSKILRVA